MIVSDRFDDRQLDQLRRWQAISNGKGVQLWIADVDAVSDD